MPNTSGSSARVARWIVSGPAILILLLLGACAQQAAPTGPFPRFAEYEGREVDRVTFSGDLEFPRDSLRAVVQTRPSRCRILFLPFCVPFTNIGRDIYRLDLPQLARDVSRIQIYHRDHGYYGAQVEPDIEPRGEDEVDVEFRIAPGRQVILRELLVQGLDGAIPEDELRQAMPLEVDEPFGRLDFLASADTIRSKLLQRGHAYADVLRNYGLDTIAGVAEVEFVALPGPVVYVDTVLFQGNERLTERTLRRQITIDEGDLLRAVELNRTQRNLYSVNMINFASVGLAPDTAQLSEEQSEATILVQVVEAAQFAVETSIGFGTVDCIRTGGRWINRNFLGGGRRLEVSGSVSRIGVGSPVDFGLERSSICTSLREEGFLGLEGFDVEDRLDFRLGAEFQQPSIFGTQNQATVNLHAERFSETGAFIRESVGSRVSIIRELETGPTILSTTADVERGRTVASPAILCVGFDTCTQEDLDLLQRSRWSNSLSLAALRDGTRSDGVITRGYLLRGGLDWASPVLGSDNRYLRVLVEGSRYWQVARGWVLASNVRVGRFLRGNLSAESDYIPPERRFYAGGPNSVRGFARNALGPTSYVIPQVPGEELRDTVGSATGGTQLVVGSAELRIPSPWMSDILRLAAFVDVGQLSAPGTELFADGAIRVTPGAGIRLITPVGPFRLDVAYNPYPPESGPLYLVDPRVGLILVDSEYRPESPGFLGRFRVQFALGQAF